MRLTHSSLGLRVAGCVAIAFGSVGLVVHEPVNTFAQEQLAAPTVEAAESTTTLAAILAGDSPATLSHEYIESALPSELFSEETVELGYDTSTALSTLYEDEPSDVQARETIADLKGKLATFDEILGASTDSAQRARLRELTSRFDRQVRLIEALDQLLASGPLSDPTVQGAAGELAARVAAAKMDLNGFTTGSAWIAYFHLDELARIASDHSGVGDEMSILDKAESRLSDLDRLDEAQRAFVERPSVANVAAGIRAVKAALAPEEQSGASDRLRDLVAAFNSLQQRGASDAAVTVRLALDWLPELGGDAGPLTALLQEEFFADNFKIGVSETLLQRVMANSQAENGLVNECVFGTRVVGEKCTASTLHVDVLPSASNARLDLLLSGTVETNTRGLDPRATVFTRGDHEFTARKVAYFDGYEFQTTPSTVGVNINSRTVGVAPKTKLPIFKQIVKNVAMDRARELRPRTNALQRRKITDQVITRFDSKFSELISSAEERLNSELYRRLRHAGLYPERQSISSTDTTVDVSSRMLTSWETGASRQSVTPAPTSGLVLQIHESYLNNALSRMDFAGHEMTSAEVRAEIKRYLEIVLGREVEMGSHSEEISSDDESAVDEELENAKFLFDESDPIRTRIEASSVYLILTAGLQTSNETIAPQTIEIPLNLSVDGHELIVEQGRIEVTPVERPRSRARQIAHAKLIAKKIRQSLPDRRIDGQFDLELESKTVPLSLRAADAYDGWLSLRMD